MLRVWGGGVYADDAFYELCDEKGILVWQDFMFACAMYPGDDPFMENVRQEVIDQATKLGSHPCIALWCGNNEVDEGWKNWGWQDQYKYSFKDSAQIWNDYIRLFHVLIPSTLDSLGIDTSLYVPSSPSIGWGHRESMLQGDSHYWGVWWGMEPFAIYKAKTGRFMSEYGFQGMPGKTVSQAIFDGDTFNLSSAKLKAHQKHGKGFETINEYLQRDYRMPRSYEQYAYVSQLLQADGMKTAIEAHRASEPRCMGTLYWQLNDCWNAVSWSSIDYSGTWKALHYTVKRCYAPVVSVIDEKDGTVNIYIVNDTRQKLNGILQMKLYQLNGDLLWAGQDSAVAANGQSTLVKQISFDQLPAFKREDALLSVTFADGKNSSPRNIYYFTPPKDLNLTAPNINYKIQNRTVTLTTDVPAKGVHVTIPGHETNWSDNYFDLLPGESKTIALPATSPVDLNRTGIKIETLTNID
jgi:beta-mannosidase